MPDFLILSRDAIAALLQVTAIDLLMAGDNAVVIGIAAAGLAQAQRTRAILVGIAAATLLRILFAAFAIQMLEIVGLLLAGGILLLWVCWKMARELRGQARHAPGALVQDNAPPKTFAQAAWQIVMADVSMSLDNVLAVAGAAREHPAALVFGLGLSIVLMGVAANFIARPAQSPSLDRLWRAGDHPLCRLRHDLARRAGGLAAPCCVRTRISAKRLGQDQARALWPEVKTIARRRRGRARAARSRIKSATRRAIAGAGSSQSTGQGATARKRSISSG